MARVLVLLAEGFEELEAISVIDILRRAEVQVVTAGLVAGPVKASRATILVPDTDLEQALGEDFDMVVLPGGMPGAKHLKEDGRVRALLVRMAEAGKWVGAICAAPMVLAHAGLLEGKQATSYPGFLDDEEYSGVANTGSAVERDGRIITSRAAGTAMDFALELVEALCGADRRAKVEAQLVRQDPVASG